MVASLKYSGGLKQYVVNATRRVRTFDALRLTAKDHIDVDTASNLHLDLTAERQPHVPGQILNNMFTLVDVHPRYSVSAARLRGFLYYHVPYPSQFLSGCLRFRCTPSREPSTFDQGHDLPNRHDLPWNIPLVRMIGRLKLGIFVNQLVLDGLLTEEQVSKARRLLAYNPEKEDHPRPSFVHGIGQPFAIDLTVPLRIAVTGPHKVFSSTIYPAVTFRGGAVVRFERDDPEAQELRLRVVKSLPDFHDRLLATYGDQRELPDPVVEDYLPEFRHLPPLRNGDLLPVSYRNASGRPWVWKYTDHDAVCDAALYCLLNPIEHFPATDPADFADTEQRAMPEAVEDRALWGLQPKTADIKKRLQLPMDADGLGVDSRRHSVDSVGFGLSRMPDDRSSQTDNAPYSRRPEPRTSNAPTARHPQPRASNALSSRPPRPPSPSSKLPASGNLSSRLARSATAKLESPRHDVRRR